jgi:hypothetical protein
MKMKSIQGVLSSVIRINSSKSTVYTGIIVWPVS